MDSFCPVPEPPIRLVDSVLESARSACNIRSRNNDTSTAKHMTAIASTSGFTRSATAATGGDRTPSASAAVKARDQSQIKWISDFIWNIADDRLRDVYVRGKYRDVILPFIVLRRLDAVLESTKEAVLKQKKFLDAHKVRP
jgi:hypothetical protein